MDPNDFLRNVFLWLAVPALGIVMLVSVGTGKIKAAGFALLALLLGAAFVFMPPSTIEALGTSVASGINHFLSR